MPEKQHRQSRWILFVGAALGLVVLSVGLAIFANPYSKAGKRDQIESAAQTNLSPLESAAQTDLSPSAIVEPTRANAADRSSLVERNPEPDPAVAKEVPRAAVNLVYPSKREFRHAFTILEKQVDENLFVLTLATRGDNKMSLVFVDLWLRKAANGTMLLSDFGQFRLFSYFDNWQKLNPKEMTLVIDGKPIVKPCHRNDGDGKLVNCEFTLEEFQTMLETRKMHLEFGPLKFEFTGSHLEGMRALASRAPDGKTVDGLYLVSHRPDGRENDDSIKNDDTLPEALQAALSERKVQIARLLSKIDTQKAGLKTAKIADDQNSMARASEAISESQTELRRLINASLAKESLNPDRFNKGDIGKLPVGYLKTMQILNKTRGELLVKGWVSGITPIFKVVGADLSNVTDDSIFSPMECFVVTGTETYKTVGGGSNTIFRLEACDDKPRFTEAEIKQYTEAADPNYEIRLTADEQAKAELAQAAHAVAKAKAMKEKEQETLQNELALKARRSKSNLESAKLLLKKDQRTAARKYLEKAITDDPDSETAKEAAKLLEEFP